MICVSYARAHTQAHAQSCVACALRGYFHLFRCASVSVRANLCIPRERARARERERLEDDSYQIAESKNDLEIVRERQTYRVSCVCADRSLAQAATEKEVQKREKTIVEVQVKS